MADPTKTVISDLGLNASQVYAEREKALQGAPFAEAPTVAGKAATFTITPSYTSEFDEIYFRGVKTRSFADFSPPPSTDNPSPSNYSRKGLAPRLGSEEVLSLKKEQIQDRLSKTTTASSSSDWEASHQSDQMRKEGGIILSCIDNLVDLSKLSRDIGTAVDSIVQG